MKDKLAIFCFILMGITDANGKIMVSSLLWDASTCIYQVDIQQHRYLQIVEFRPTGDLLRLVKVDTIAIELPELTMALQDASILMRREKLLFILTTEGQLLIVDLSKRQIDAILHLADYFSIDMDYSGRITIFNQADEAPYVAIAVNAVQQGILILTFPKDGSLVTADLTSLVRTILLPEDGGIITTAVEVAKQADVLQLFVGARLASGGAIWEVAIAEHVSRRLYKLGLSSLQYYFVGFVTARTSNCSCQL